MKFKKFVLFKEYENVFLNDGVYFWNKMYKFSVLMFVFSVFCYYLYSKAYGGFLGLLNHTILIRIGQMSVVNKWSFLQKFGSFSFISSICLFSIYTNNKIYKVLRLKSFLFWVLSFVFCLYVAYSQGGRGSFINIFLVYILGTSFKYTNNILEIIKKKWLSFFLLPLVFILINNLWKRAEFNNLQGMIASGFTYLFDSFYVNLGNYNFRFFYDFVIIPVIFLPSSVYSKWGITTANQFNTFLVQGGFKGNVINGELITGESTTGLLSFSYMQLGLVGVIIVSILFGMFLKKCQDRIDKMPDTTFKFMIQAYYVVFFVYAGVGGGDTSALILMNFGYIIFFLLYMIYIKVKI